VPTWASTFSVISGSPLIISPMLFASVRSSFARSASSASIVSRSTGISARRKCVVHAARSGSGRASPANTVVELVIAPPDVAPAAISAASPGG
jgi:hypothetical protein